MPSEPDQGDQRGPQIENTQCRPTRANPVTATREHGGQRRRDKTDEQGRTHLAYESEPDRGKEPADRDEADAPETLS